METKEDSLPTLWNVWPCSSSANIDAVLILLMFYMHNWRYTIAKTVLKSYDGKKYMSIRQNSKYYAWKYTVADVDIWLKLFKMKSSTLWRHICWFIQYHMRKLSPQSKIHNWLFFCWFLLLINSLHNCKTTLSLKTLQILQLYTILQIYSLRNTLCQSRKIECGRQSIRKVWHTK